MDFQNRFAGWLTTDKENERLARVGAIISGHRRPNISNRSLGNAPSAVAYLSLGVTQRVATNLAWQGKARRGSGHPALFRLFKRGDSSNPHA
jgi:hypothetical protein